MSRAPKPESRRPSIPVPRTRPATASAAIPVLLLAAGFVAEPIAAQDLEPALDEYVGAYHRLGDFSGCVLIARREANLFQRCYGQADYELGVANTPTTKFRIGSVSKQFTAAAILVLEARGRIDVDDPIAEYLPDYPNGDRITIHHLLTHTSGIPNLFAVPGYESVKRNKVTPRELVSLFRDRPLDFEPGERFSYSNSGYVLLAHLIEIVSGQRFGDFLHDALFAPLGLSDTRHERLSPIIPGRASGYDPVGVDGLENAPFIDPSTSVGAGSLVSTVGDLRRWVSAMSTDRLLADEGRVRMFARHAGSYGYGVAVYSEHGRRIIAHDGRVAGFTADLSWYPDDDLAVIVLSNVQTGIGDSFRRDLAAIVFGEAYELPAERSAAASTGRLRDYVGRYRFGPSFIVHARLDENRLWVAANESEFSELIRLSDGRFFNRVTYSHVTFDRGADGGVQAMIWIQDGNEFRGERLPDR